MRATHRSPYRMLIVATVTALLAVPAISAGADDDQPQIGFVSGENPLAQDLELHLSDADGTGRVGLTADFGAGQHWAWSPDGSRVGVLLRRLRQRDALRPRPRRRRSRLSSPREPIPMTGGRGHRIAPGSRTSPCKTETLTSTSPTSRPAPPSICRTIRRETTRPRWSPTGTHLAYDVRRAGVDNDYVDVHIVPALGGEPVNVTDDTDGVRAALGHPTAPTSYSSRAGTETMRSIWQTATVATRCG